MAKRKGPLGLLFKSLFLLALVVGIAGVAVSLFYPDEDLGSQLRGAGLPEAQIDQVLAVKRRIKSTVDITGDDFVYTARSLWWDLRDAFDLDLTSKATLDLPPVRHVTQATSMAMEGDPKEPAVEGTDAPADPAPPQETPDALVDAENRNDGMTDPTEPGTAMPGEAMAPEGAQATDPSMAEQVAQAMAEQMPAEATTPEPAAPEATDKPVDLTQPPAAPEAQPEPAAPEAASEDIAALPGDTAAEPTPAAPQPPAAEAADPAPPAAPAAPAAPPPATAEERLAAADLSYKRALALFAQADTADQKSEVAKLFAQAAIDGHPGAQYSIGVMHYNGTGVAQDYAKAAEWFGRAAEKSNAAAQYNLGILYYNGQGVPKDDKLAYKWISAAAENGDQKAIVARDALKKALPASITAPPATTFPNARAPAAEGGGIEITAPAGQ